MRVIGWLRLLVLGFAHGDAQHGAWWRNVDTISPNQHPDLPDNVRPYLTARDCTILQAFESGFVHKVVTGQFVRPGQEDLAVLAERDHISVILVFERSDTTVVHQVNPAGTRVHVIAHSDSDEPVYGRRIRRVPALDVREEARHLGGPVPKRAGHDGIEDALVGHVRLIHYRENGRWLLIDPAESALSGTQAEMPE